jgi:hypothetical protein
VLDLKNLKIFGIIYSQKKKIKKEIKGETKMEKKITKIEVLGIIKEAMADNEVVVAYCDNEIAHLEAKAVKAKERAAEKRAAGDELYAAVIGCVGTDPVTADAVLAMLEGDDLTLAKVRARLSQGVANGVLAKESIKVDGKAKMHYTLVG